MFPRIRHRLVIALTALAGAFVWLLIAGALKPADGLGGISLLWSHTGVAQALMLVALAGLPSLVMGLVISAMGNPMSGLFVVCAGLSALALWGGPIDGWMTRAHLPGDYQWLMLESLIWQAGVVVMLMSIQRLRSPMRAWYPALAYDDHLGVDVHLHHPHLQAWIGGAIASVCGFALGWFLIRSSDPAQVVVSLLAAFAAGGVAAGLIYPQASPVGVLFSPTFVALAAYAYAMASFQTDADMLGAWYQQNLPGVTLVLPIYYTSAGTAGCTLGLGLAQVIESTKPMQATA